MQTRFLLGPSGSGKTCRCLAEARSALQASPSGAPLVFISPKQATFQLERQLLADPSLCGYTRLRIVSFERLAEWIVSEFRQPPQLLSEEGRLMVLRALLSRKRQELKLFRATARLRGFAQQLSVLLREFQRSEVTSEQMVALSARLKGTSQLALKLQDVAAMLRAYLDWLGEHRLRDQDQLLGLATDALHKAQTTGPAGMQAPARGGSGALGGAGRVAFHFEALWLDGFAELSPQEMAFLKALLPCCERATLAFNLDRSSLGPVSWLVPWSTVGQTYRQLAQRLSEQPGLELVTEWLERDQPQTRFASNPYLRHLERNWSNPQPLDLARHVPAGAPALEETIRVAICPNPESEATLAAREILRFVRKGGRYREAAVIVRNLEKYGDPVRRVFRTYGIPFFLDRREPVGHHPMLELTRSALRTVAFDWEAEDWFGALKTGLVYHVEHDIDRLENEALARGWTGKDWLQPLKVTDAPELAEWLEPLRQRLAAPFEQLKAELGDRPSGSCLAAALARFWQRLEVANRLQAWSAQPALHGGTEVAALVHGTLWEQMQDWLDNLALAFADEALSLREWLPVLEAGLASQTVGVIPPNLDQVLVGAIDRSRNPDLNLAVLLGVNESVFPALPNDPNLLTPGDREELGNLGVVLGANARGQLARERYLGYIACTRARERLVITCALRDENDKALNPSPFIDHLRRLFPGLSPERAQTRTPWTEAEHVVELIAPALRQLANAEGGPALPEALAGLRPVAELKERWTAFQAAAQAQNLAPALAECLYGKTLETSVSRLEEYAACPFRFFLTSGLRVEERKRFQLDARQQGSFQHEVLARFHQELRAEKKRWRDLTADEARRRVGRIAESLALQYQDGLLQATEQSRFTARTLAAALQNFVAAVIDWMPQYEFDPEAVELAFGIEERPLPAWELDLGEGHRLSFRGKIDRIDLWRDPADGTALCVVMDYKSSQRRLDPVLMAHGVQLQLLAYLNVLHSLEDPEKLFGVKKLVPAGVFFVNLRGRYSAAKSRTEALAGFQSARALAYQHTGRFDLKALPRLDNRQGAQSGDQFKYRLRKDGQIYGNCREVLDRAEFRNLLQGVEEHLRRMGCEIYAGNTRVDPFRNGNATACDKCDFQSVCRIDPWSHTYRVLEGKAPAEAAESDA